MTDLFTCQRHVRGILSSLASCPWTKQGYLEKCSNEKLPTSSWLMTEPSSTADFASTLSNVNNVKISDLLEFLVTLLFSTHCFHPKIIWKKLQDHEKIHGGDNLKKISSSSFFPFSPPTLQNYIWMATFLWSFL